MQVSSTKSSCSIRTGSSTDIDNLPISTVAVGNEAIPRSVRGAPPEMRRLIRKKQNADSARRCRLKLRLDREREAERNAPLPLSNRVQHLTKLLREIHERLAATEISCAALLEREFIPLPTENATQQSNIMFTSHQQLPAESHLATEIYQPITQPHTHFEMKPQAKADVYIMQPKEAFSNKAFAQPLSPTTVNFPAFFDTSAVPFNSELFNEKSTAKQQYPLASTTEDLPLF